MTVFGQVNYQKLDQDKDSIINGKTPVQPAKPDGQSAADLIKNPAQPAIYTLWTDFKVPVESKHKISYQPYVASVGADATPAEKAKVKKIIDLPNLVGFEPPNYEEDFSVNYQDIVYEAKNATKTEDKVNGDRYTANQDFKYQSVSKTVQVKDVFQDIKDFNKYDQRKDDLREQAGHTGSALQVSPLQDSEIRGFVAEEPYITVQVPGETEGFVVEYRYNRNHYEVTFDTGKGNPVPARELFYGQTIPTLDSSEIPTQNGKKLVGWTASPTLKDANDKPYTTGHLKSDLSGGLIMPAGPVKFTAVWQDDPSASAKNPATEATYTVNLDDGKGNIKGSKVNSGTKVDKPSDPYRQGYTFMGWQWVEKSKTNQTPVLYSFNNPVTSDINLKAIWVKNDRVDLDIYHYFLDKDGNKDTSQYPNPLKEKLYDKRIGDFSATVGDQISDKWTLASPEEIENSKSDEIKDAYENYKAKSFNNSFFQKTMVEADNSNGANEFRFFYRPFKQREYKVNYIDERFKGKPNEKDGAIIDQELVTNGNRHYDARNYRPIPGWKLTSAPQQQLFFNVNEETNEFLGINNTGKDEITFYYKDVRIIDVKDPKETVPEGYVRVTFKADEGGSFGKDDKGNDIKEIKYYVIKGLKSDLLPIPKELKQGETKDTDKYYITPDNGKNFKEWADSPLLNDNVIIEKDYTFTAKFEWSGVVAKELVTTEAFEDPNNTWTNKFAPKLEDLKNQIVWMENGQEKPLPNDATVRFEGITNDEDIYEKLKELGVADKDQEYRIVNFKAIVEFKGNKNTKEIDLPVKVYKNRYEALTSGDKPLFLSDAEKNELKGILSDTAEKRYIKVTVNPSNKPNNKDSKIYYVNPKAWVDIPEIKLSAEDKAKLKFLNWTSDNDDVNVDGEYIFEKENIKQRYKFTKDTIIYPVSAADVIEQKEKDKNVPESYVKVIVNTTDNATDESKFERTFWVDSSKKVEISVTQPIGKTKQKINIPGLGEKEVDYTFKGWQKVKTGTDENNLADLNPAMAIDIDKNQYTDKVTVVEAAYYEKFAATPIVKPIKTDELHTPEGKEITDKDLIEQITPPENKTIKSIRVIEKPDPSKPGKQEAKITIEYTDGSTQGSESNPLIIPVEVHKNIIPSYDGKKPEGALDNYVKITFKAGEGGTISDEKKKAYYVSPEVEVDMTSIAEAITKTPNTGYIKDTWDKELKAKFENDTVFTFNFKKTKDIVEKTDDSVEKPKDYVELIFSTDGNGKLDNNKDKIVYYVNPKAGIKIVKLSNEQTAGDKEIAVPTPKANANYEFEKWREELNLAEPITADRHYVAGFKLVKVTLTYDKGGDDVQGTAPNSVTRDHGSKVVLANQEKLTKENYTFLGWKLDTGDTDRIYKPGEDIVLTADTKATAQWKIIQHKVSFDTKGGSLVDSQEVDRGSTATRPETNPTKAGFVFMGWKEKGQENQTAYYDFNTKIIADKTLVAIWEEAVQKIGENDSVGEEFIKVKFEQGKHGSLDGDTLYKVGKDLSFKEAVQYGLVVPTIKPNEYYKAKEENAGWDKPLVLNKQSITFTAQYELESSVIPIKPGKTDEQIKNEKPEGMIVVDFKVDPEKFYMVGTSKFYVKTNELVTITPPVVLAKKVEYVFKGWANATVVDDKINQEFKEDYTITDSKVDELELIITVPKEGQKRVYIEKLSGQKGVLEIISDGSSTPYDSTTFKRRGKEYKVFNLNSPVKAGDILKYWAEDQFRTSLPKQALVK